MNTTEKKERLLLISTDERLAHLLAAEAQELCIGLRTERTAAILSSLPPTIRLVLWDLDTVTPLYPASLPECPIYGVTRQEPPATFDLPMTRILHRPFSIDQLRHELVRIIFAEQSALANAHELHLPIRMADDGTTLHIGEGSFVLTENEAAIMSVLLQHRGQTVTKEALRQAIANQNDTASVSNKVEVYLCHLRAKLEQPLGRRLFTTIRGQGYRLDPGNE